MKRSGRRRGGLAGPGAGCAATAAPGRRRTIGSFRASDVWRAHVDALPVKLVLLDVKLPKKYGREVLQEVRRIPVIVLRTSAKEADSLRCYELHANAYLTKPGAFADFVVGLQQLERFWLQVVRLASVGWAVAGHMSPAAPTGRQPS